MATKVWVNSLSYFLDLDYWSGRDSFVFWVFPLPLIWDCAWIRKGETQMQCQEFMQNGKENWRDILSLA